jgi:anti-anti-sigma factor
VAGSDGETGSGGEYGSPSSPAPEAELTEEPQAAIERSVRDGVHALTVTGELDISNVGELRNRAAQIPAEALGLVVDLSQATFIDSATVGFLFELRHSLERRGQVLQIVCPPDSAAERVLAMTSFDADVRDEPDLDSAVAAVRRKVPLEQ